MLKQFQRVTLLLDGDEAGKNAAEEISRHLVRRLFVRIVDVSEGKQPDSLTETDLKDLLK